MAISKFLNPQNDFAFKRIFGTEGNADILIPFLNAMLSFSGDAEIKEVSFIQTNHDPEVKAAKQSAVDVMCSDHKGRHYIVEMQISNEAGFEKRAQYYAAKAYSRQMMKGEAYNNLKEIIFLAITNFVMFPDKTAYKSEHVILDKTTYSHDLKDFSFTFLELPKFTKKIEELNNIVEKWTYFFKHAAETTAEDLPRLVGSDHVIERAYEELDQFNWSEIELNTYEQVQKYDLDEKARLLYSKEIGEAEGLAKGLVQGKVELLLTVIQVKFKPHAALQQSLETKLLAMNTKALLAFTEKVLAANSLEELF